MLSRNTIAAYRLRLEDFARYLGNREATPIICRNWLNHLLASGSGRRTAATLYGTLRTFFEWQMDMGLIKANPVPKLRRFVVPQAPERPAYSQDDVEAVVARARLLGRRDWAYATLCGWHTGLRLGDVVTLRSHEIDFSQGIIRRTPEKTKRFGKSVEIPIPVALIDAIHECPPYPEADQSFVCQTLAQKYLFNGHATLSVEFGRIAAAAGVEKSFHCLRHGCVTRMINAGHDSVVIRSITGHSTTRQVAGYAKVSIDAKRKALNQNV